MTGDTNGTNDVNLFAKEETLDRLGGDTELLVVTADIFLQELSNMMSAICQAIVNGTPDDLRIAAHTLKGAASNVGAVGMSKLSFELEKLGVDGDLSGTDVILETLKTEAERLEPVLNEFIRRVDVT